MWNVLPPYAPDLILLFYILHKSNLPTVQYDITGAEHGEITFGSGQLSPHPPMRSMGKLTIGNMLMGRSCRGYWGVNNEKFLQEAPSNNEIHRAEILFSDEKKLQRYLPSKSVNHFTESDS